MHRSTRPVAKCLYGVSYINFVFGSLHIFLSSFPVNAVSVSDLIVWGIPFNKIYCFRNVVAVFPVGASQIHATGHLLLRSIEICMKNCRFLNPIGPIKPN